MVRAAAGFLHFSHGVWPMFSEGLTIFTRSTIPTHTTKTQLGVGSAAMAAAVAVVDKAGAAVNNFCCCCCEGSGGLGEQGDDVANLN